MGNIIFRQAEEIDIPVLVELHAKCMDEKEMSNKLGYVFIESFYKHIIKYSTSEINLAETGGQIFVFR